MLFKDIVDAKRCAFFNDAVDWRDAIRKSCIPLKKTGCATADYEERIIQCVEEFGPYIVIVPGLAIINFFVNNCKILQEIFFDFYFTVNGQGDFCMILFIMMKKMLFQSKNILTFLNKGL